MSNDRFLPGPDWRAWANEQMQVLTEETGVRSVVLRHPKLGAFMGFVSDEGEGTAEVLFLEDGQLPFPVGQWPEGSYV